MQQKMTTKKIKLITKESFVDVVDYLVNVKDLSYPDINKKFGNKKGFYNNIRNVYKGAVNSPSLSIMQSITKGIETLIKQYPEVEQKIKYVYVIPPKRWSYCWDKYGCTEGEFKEFIKDIKISFEGCMNYVKRYNSISAEPRYETLVAFSAYIKYRQTLIGDMIKYYDKVTVDHNPSGRKLRTKERLTRQFWLQQNRSSK